MVTLLLLLFFILSPCSESQEDFLDQHQTWNYRAGADKVNVEGITSITQTLEKWGNDIFWQMKHTLLNNPNSLLPELSSSVWSDLGLCNPSCTVACSTLPFMGKPCLRPVSAAVDNLVREVKVMRRRLEELNERLGVISRSILPLRLSLQSQGRGSAQLRRLPMHRRLYTRRRPQRR